MWNYFRGDPSIGNSVDVNKGTLSGYSLNCDNAINQLFYFMWVNMYVYQCGVHAEARGGFQAPCFISLSLSFQTGCLAVPRVGLIASKPRHAPASALRQCQGPRNEHSPAWFSEDSEVQAGGHVWTACSLPCEPPPQLSSVIQMNTLKNKWVQHVVMRFGLCFVSTPGFSP